LSGIGGGGGTASNQFAKALDVVFSVIENVSGPFAIARKTAWVFAYYAATKAGNSRHGCRAEMNIASQRRALARVVKVCMVL
jgi:hypothetical protein